MKAFIPKIAKSNKDPTLTDFVEVSSLDEDEEVPLDSSSLDVPSSDSIVVKE